MQPPRAIHFPPFGIALRSRQSRSIGPNCGCKSSHASRRLEDFAKQAAARIKKGVVGKTGRNAPIKPSATKPSPKDR